MATLRKKMMISLFAANTCLLLNLPGTYTFLNKTGISFYNENTGCPTHIGLLLITVLFFILTYITMGSSINKGIKIKHSLYGTLIFYLVSSPTLYAVMGSILGNKIANKEGCPTNIGILLHSFIYFLILVAVMYLP